VWWLAWTGLALAGPVTWEGVADEALDAWSRTGGEVVQAQVDGARHARSAGPMAPSLLVQSRTGVEGAQEASASLQVPMGLGVRARQSWSRRAELFRAQGAVDRQAYVEQVLSAFTTWWTARELAEHLHAWSQEVERTLEPMDRAVEQGLAAPLDAEDLRAELAGVRAEAAAAQASALRAEAELRALLGPDVELSGEDLHLHDLDVTALDNPWTALVERAGEAPRVRVQEAQADWSLAQARLQARWMPQLQGGVAMTDEPGDWTPMLFAGVQLPFRPSGLGQARLARAQATAARRQAEWQTWRVRGEWAAQATAFDAEQARIARLDDEVVAPLERRLRRLEQAFAAGLVPADRVIRARRDHHEAEHERLVLTARLLASQAHARAELRLLEAS